MKVYLKNGITSIEIDGAIIQGSTTARIASDDTVNYQVNGIDVANEPFTNIFQEDGVTVIGATAAEIETYHSNNLVFKTAAGGSVALVRSFKQRVESDGGITEGSDSLYSFSKNNINIIKNASLVLTPNGYKSSKLYALVPSDGSGDMTWARASEKTRVNESGLGEIAPYNLLKYSENLTISPWVNDGTMTLNSGEAPDGSNTANLWTFSVANNVVFQRLSNLMPNTTYNFSFYVKSGTVGTAKIAIYDEGNAVYLTALEEYTSSPSEWQRKSISFTTGVTAAIIRVYPKIGTTATGTMFFWGAQVTAGAAELPYLKTTDRANIPHVYPYGLVETLPYNLLKHSEDFGNATTWATFVFDGGSIAKFSGQSDPNGGVDAYRFDTTTGTGGVLFTQNIVVSPNVQFSMKLNLKGVVGGEKVRIDFRGSSSAGVSGLLCVLTTEWQEFDIPVTNDSGTARGFQFRMLAGEALANQSFFVFGAQLTNGSTAKPYLKTTDRLNIPSIDYSSGSGAILVEPQATNLCTYSNSFDVPNWIKVRASFLVNNAISPFGINNASKLVEDISVNSHFSHIDLTYSGATTISIYAKASERNWLVIANESFGANFAYFDLLNGVIGTVSGFVNPKIINCGNGWYRCIVTVNVPTSTIYDIVLGISTADNTYSYAGDGVSGLFVFGAQAENGSVATSYIPTGATTATRVADATENVPNVSLFNQLEGTIIFDVNYKTHTGVLNVFNSIKSAANVNFTVTYIKSDGKFGLDFYLNGSYTLSISCPTAMTENAINKMAIRYKAGQYAVFLNGVKESSSANPTAPSTSLAKNVFSPTLNGSYNNYIYLPLAYSDAEIVELTTL